MKTSIKRKQAIYELVELVSDWDLDMLEFFVKEQMKYILENLDNNNLAKLYGLQTTGDEEEFKVTD